MSRVSKLYNGEVNEKACTMCKQTKPLTSFYKATDKSSRGWRYVSYCSSCHNKKRWPLNQAKRRKEQEVAAGRPKPEQCDLCGSSERICWDHDHATGEFRGWLCNRCNTVLGMVEDKIELLDALSIYLKRLKK